MVSRKRNISRRRSIALFPSTPRLILAKPGMRRKKKERGAIP